MLGISISLLLALLLAAWFTWLTVRRPNRRWLWARLLATWGVVACLAMLVSPPKITRTYSASEAILLTEGYSTDTLQALLRQDNPALQIFTFGVSQTGAEGITDFTQFKQEHPTVQTLHVLGYGIEPEEIAAIRTLRMVPHLSPLPPGVLSANWPQEIPLAQEVRVQGRFNTADQTVKLFLSSNGIDHDSVALGPGQQEFTLRFTPKISGSFVYNLRWQGESDTVYQEQVPVTIVPTRKLSILMLSSAPSFEGRFLKNELARQGQKVAVRNQITKGIFQTEFVNLTGLNLDILTPSLLQKFDVVLLDAATLQSLTANEKQALQKAVREQGLGVLTIFSDNSPTRIPFFAEARFDRVSQKEVRNAQVTWPGKGKGAVALSAPAFVLQMAVDQQILAWEDQEQKNALAAHWRKGMGQVGVSLLPETFPLALAGQEQAYRRYWATLLTALAKKDLKSVTLAPEGFAPFRVFQPANLISTISVDSVTSLDVQQQNTTSHPGLLNSISSLHWPTTAGWHTAYHQADSLGTLYIHHPNTWPLLRLQEKKKVLSDIVATPAPNLPVPLVTVMESSSLWPFYILLLILLGLLWIEEKL